MIEQNKTKTQYEHCTEALDQAVQGIESAESSTIVAPNAQYRDEQYNEIVSKASE